MSSFAPKVTIVARFIFFYASVTSVAFSAPITLDFTEIPGSRIGTDGLAVNGLTFRYSLNNTSHFFFPFGGRYNEQNIWSGTYVQRGGVLMAPIDGLLSLEFPKPTPVLDFGVALSFERNWSGAKIEVELFDASLNSLGLHSVNLSTSAAVGQIFRESFREGQFTHSGVPVAKAVIHGYGSHQSPIGGPLLLVDNVRFEPPTFEDIVRGSVSAYADRGMHATFQPNFGFGLEEAARLGNFDHFNWVQFVEEDSLLQDLSHPLHGQHSQGLQTMNGPSVVRFVDPAPGGFYYMTELAGAPGRFPVADRNVAYYDEEYNFPDGFFGDPPLLIPPDFVGRGPLSWRLAELGDNTRDENLAVPGLDTLKFTDRPSGADYVFLTCLAGIGGQVGLRILNRGGLETCFRWKYTWSREQAEILGYLLASGENRLYAVSCGNGREACGLRGR